MKHIKTLFAASIIVSFGLVAINSRKSEAKPDCKDTVSAIGQAYTNINNAEAIALQRALYGWGTATKAQHGSAYATWNMAKNRQQECEGTAGKYYCEVIANSCRKLGLTMPNRFDSGTIKRLKTK